MGAHTRTCIRERVHMYTSTRAHKRTRTSAHMHACTQTLPGAPYPERVRALHSGLPWHQQPWLHTRLEALKDATAKQSEPGPRRLAGPADMGR